MDLTTSPGGWQVWEAMGLCIVAPNPHQELLPGVCWGRQQTIGTPAFWHLRGKLAENDPAYFPTPIGESLSEEIAACLLGAYGVPAEVGLAAFELLRARVDLDNSPQVDCILQVLQEPLYLGHEIYHYRFAAQRARWLAASLAVVHEIAEISDDLSWREALTALPGVGRKTASWIVRNLRGSDDIAVLDVHVLRALRYCGVLSYENRDYLDCESRYLEFAGALSVRASVLDKLIWHVSRIGQLGRIRGTG
jgi:N-glycosylase/DNA lyase